MKGWIKGGIALALMLLVTPALFAQTTGRIDGRTLGTDGEPIPGVTVTASSPSLQGTQTQTTDANGVFRFVNLPPGFYTVRAELEGFNNVEQPQVRVGIDRTVSLEFTMTTAVTAEVTVLGTAPVVDTTKAETGVSISSETFDQLPLTRDFYAVAQVAPGVAADAAGTMFYGSTGAENQYLIEGLNTTGAELGIEGKVLNFDFIKEVEVKTGGLEAEYGRITGGIISAITKSGGNEFEGDVFGYYAGGDLQSDDSTGPDLPHWATTVENVDEETDYGFDLGGYLVKDSLWFFLAYDRVDRQELSTIIRPIDSPGTPGPGSKVPSDVKSDLYAGKLTWRLNANHNLALSAFGDPREQDGNLFVISGPPSTWQGHRESGADDYVLRYDGVFGGSWILEGLAGVHQEEDKFFGPGKTIPQFRDQRVSPVAFSGGFGFHQDEEYEREVLKADLTKFLGNFELKVGVDEEDVQANIARFDGGAGQRIYIFNNRAAGGGPTVYRHRFFVNDRAPGFNRDDPNTWTLAAPLVSEPNSVNTSAYAQMSWKATDTFTLNVGGRYEKQEINDRDGITAIELENDIAPRVGFTWDVLGNGRSKLYGAYGQYYESIPLDINIRAFGGESTCFCYNFSPDPNNIVPLPRSQTGFTSSLLGGATPVDPDLEGQYINEALLGFEYEVAPNFALGVQATMRELGQVIEDFLVIEEGHYFIANPGAGQFGRTMTFYDYSTVPAPEAERDFVGVELSARKRFSDGWQFFASYLWSELEGNYDGVFQASTGQLDPNINSAFDYADFLINADGKLSNNREHTLKAAGGYVVQGGPLDGFNIGASGYFQTGTPLTAYGFSFLYQNWEYYLTPRGSLGENPDEYEVDLHLGYPIKLGSDNTLDILLDVFNLLDRQAITTLDQRYNLSEHGGCGGIPEEHCNHDNGLLHDGPTINPTAQLPNPRATAPNPSFLRKGTAFTPQRNIRLGLRYSF